MNFKFIEYAIRQVTRTDGLNLIISNRAFQQARRVFP